MIQSKKCGENEIIIEIRNLITRSLNRGDGSVFAEMTEDESLSEVCFDSDCKNRMEDWVPEAIANSEADEPRIRYSANTVCQK